MSALPATGLRILDFGQGYAAIPGMILADYGADVIKVEPPQGERFRALPAFAQWNRGKRSVVLDLVTDRGRADVALLARTCDVVVESFRPGVAERLGIGYDTLAAANPGLVHLSISGFGPRDRLAGVKAYEGIVAAKTGQFVIQNGYRDDGPIYDAVPKCSFGAAMLGLVGVLGALHLRDRSGIGQKVDTSLVRSNFVYSYDGIRGETPEASRRLSLVQGRDPHNVMPGYRIAECADGQWIQSGSAAAGIFDNLMRALGIDAFFTDAQFADGVNRLSPDARDDLIAMIDDAYRKRPLAEWLKILADNDAAYGVFMTTQEFMDYPQMVHNGHVIDVDDPVHGPMQQVGPLVRFAGSTWEWPGPAPRLGEHTESARAEAVALGAASTREGAAPPELPAGPLEGITILDLSMYAASPGGPGLLADLGARVIKIEPIKGDPLGMGGVGGGELFYRVNRGKERIALDLKAPDGQAVLHKLVRSADVLLHNFRPGVPERIGADYDTLKGLNEQLVYVYGASFGSTGPDAHRPAFDAVISAMAGGEILQGGQGNPPQQRQTTDHSALLGVAVAILLGLRERDRTGAGQSIETTMLASAAYLFSDDFIRYQGKPERPLPDAGQHGLHALYRLYPAADGSWVFLACPFDDEWNALIGALPDAGLADDSRFASPDQRRLHDEALTGALAAAFAARSAADWERHLLAHDVACVAADGTWPAYLFDEGERPDVPLLDFEMDGVGRVRQCGGTVALSATPVHPRNPEPFGASSRAILAELGYRPDQIDDLAARGVVVTD